MNNQINEHILVLVNPVSGLGKSLEAVDYIKKQLAECSLEIIESEYKNHFQEITKSKNLSKYDKIIVVGGDGTMHEILNGIIDRADVPPILLFPCGTGNAFNHDLMCLDWNTAIERLKAGKTQKIDVYKISSKAGKETIYGFNVAGWGLVSRINLLAEKLRILGSIRYSVASFIYIFINPKFKANLEIDGETLTGDFSFVLVCNNMYTGTGMKMAPLADFSDGLLDVLIIRKNSFLKLLMLFPKIFSGKHLDSPLVDYRKVRKISIEAEPLCLVVDGEIKAETPLEFEILDKRIELIV